MMSCLSKLLIGHLVAFELKECTSVDVFEVVLGVDSFFFFNQVRVCNYLIETDHILITESHFCFRHMNTTIYGFIQLFRSFNNQLFHPFSSETLDHSQNVSEKNPSLEMWMVDANVSVRDDCAAATCLALICYFKFYLILYFKLDISIKQQT